MLKKIGIATLALAGMLAFGATRADARVRFGVGIGVPAPMYAAPVGPYTAYPAYPYGYPYYYAPYTNYAPYAYDYPYYYGPSVGLGFGWGGYGHGSRGVPAYRGGGVGGGHFGGGHFGGGSHGRR